MIDKIVREEMIERREERGERREEKEEILKRLDDSREQAPTLSVRLFIILHVIVYYFAGTFNNTLPPPLGIYATFGLLASDCTIALLASIFLNATNASPAFSSARDIVPAASASPSARMTAA